MTTSTLAVYLCGPINGCTDAECKDWRNGMKRIFPNAIDPMRRDYRGKEKANAIDIVQSDRRDVAHCEAVLAYCPKPSVGTSMEICYAYMYGKRVVAVVPDKSKASPWLLYHAEVVETFDAAVAKLTGKEL